MSTGAPAPASVGSAPDAGGHRHDRDAAAGEHQQHGDGCLVVGAEDPLVGVFPERRRAGPAPRARAAARCPCARTAGCTAARPRSLPREGRGADPREQVAAVRARDRRGVVLAHLDPERPQLPFDPLVRRHARDRRDSRYGRARRRCRAGSGAPARQARAWNARPRRVCGHPRARAHGSSVGDLRVGLAALTAHLTARSHASQRGGGDELAEQRRGALGAGLELGVELRGEEEWMPTLPAGQLDRLDEALVG